MKQLSTNYIPLCLRGKQEANMVCSDTMVTPPLNRQDINMKLKLSARLGLACSMTHD